MKYIIITVLLLALITVPMSTKAKDSFKIISITSMKGISGNEIYGLDTDNNLYTFDFYSISWVKVLPLNTIAVGEGGYRSKGVIGTGVSGGSPGGGDVSKIIKITI